MFASLLRIFLFCVCLAALSGTSAQGRARDYGLHIGVMRTGAWNAITDVSGVRVGQTTIVRGTDVRTGVTAILPHGENLFQQKVPAAVFAGNGFGKLTGVTQVQELGQLETPIVLTNTLSVSAAIDALVEFTLEQPGNAAVLSVNAVVGETNDGWLNDIRGRHVRKEDVLAAIRSAAAGPVTEGNVGAGTGTVCFGYKGGIGTASRLLPANLGGYTVGVLVQTNFGGNLHIDGVPIGEELGKFSFRDEIQLDADGSCMIIVATDAPLEARNLERLAKRAFMGLARTGGIASNGSGDYVIAFSTAPALRIPHLAGDRLLDMRVLPNDRVTPLFMAAIEATEEAIINSLFAAKSTTGKAGRKVEALPLDRVIPLLKKYNR